MLVQWLGICSHVINRKYFKYILFFIHFNIKFVKCIKWIVYLFIWCVNFSSTNSFCPSQHCKEMVMNFLARTCWSFNISCSPYNTVYAIHYVPSTGDDAGTISAALTGPGLPPWTVAGKLLSPVMIDTQRLDHQFTALDQSLTSKNI